MRPKLEIAGIDRLISLKSLLGIGGTLISSCSGGIPCSSSKDLLRQSNDPESDVKRLLRTVGGIDIEFSLSQVELFGCYLPSSQPSSYVLK